MKVFILSLLLLLAQCSSNTPTQRVIDNAECALTYDTNEALFTDSDTLIFGVNVIYFMNGDSSEYDRDFLEDKLEFVSSLFRPALISFKLLSYSNIEGVPSDRLVLSNSVRDKLVKYDINNYQFFGMMMNEPHVINIYVYNQPERTAFAGVAGGIGSDYLAIRKDYFDPPARTLVHELGHCLGLYHTHQADETDGYNIYTGDKVCDTPAGKSLSGTVDRECNMIKTYDALSDSIQKVNLMSYSYPFCRDSFTENQVLRMRWFIEQSKDLQSLLYNRHDLINRKLEEGILNLQ